MQNLAGTSEMELLSGRDTGKGLTKPDTGGDRTSLRGQVNGGQLPVWSGLPLSGKRLSGRAQTYF